MLDLILPPSPKKSIYKRITNPVRKISYLLALHATHRLYLLDKDKLRGVLDIIEGLEYHIKRIRNYERAACRRSLELKHSLSNEGPCNLPLLSKRTNHYPAVHEAVAYIGRLGQLSYLFESDWFSSEVGEAQVAAEIPSILALMPIRNKHVAHRQQDAPYKDDCPNLGLNEYGLKHGLVCLNKTPEIVNLQYSFPSKQRHPWLDKYHPSPVAGIEHLGSSNNLTVFTPTMIHSKIMEEAIGLLQRFFGFQAQTP